MAGRVPLFLLLIFFFPSVAAYTIEVTPDHAPWSMANGVDRFAVRIGNCMGWTVQASEGDVPAALVGVSVTDSDGRRSLHTTNDEGLVRIGTRTCWNGDHVADHAFEVTTGPDGRPASSNRVVHEVMWSHGQVYANAPPAGTGTTSIPVKVVWTATGEAMPVPSVTVTYGNKTHVVGLTAGAGTVSVDLDGESSLSAEVPVEAWPSGGPGAAILVRQAGPFVVPATASGSSAGPGSGQQAQPAAGQGAPPAENRPSRASLPPPATPLDNELVDDNGQDPESTSNTSSRGRGAPALGVAGPALALLSILILRRQRP